MAVDVGDGLTDRRRLRHPEVPRERWRRAHRARSPGLGLLPERLGSLGVVNEFHDKSVDPSTMCDDQDTPTISWPNYHSGANGDYQPVLAEGPVHELLRTTAPPADGSNGSPPPARGPGVGEGPFRHRTRAGPQHCDRTPLQPCGSARWRGRAGRPADGPGDRRIDVPPFRRLQLGSRSWGALVRHRGARQRRSRPTRRGSRSSRTTSATSRRGCSPRRTCRWRYDGHDRRVPANVSEQLALSEATDGREGATLDGRPVVILTTIGPSRATTARTL